MEIQCTCKEAMKYINELWYSGLHCKLEHNHGATKNSNTFNLQTLQNVWFIKDHSLARRSSWGAGWVSIRHAPKLSSMNSESICMWAILEVFCEKLLISCTVFPCHLHNLVHWATRDLLKEIVHANGWFFKCIHIIKWGCTFCRVVLLPSPKVKMNAALV